MQPGFATYHQHARSPQQRAKRLHEDAFPIYTRSRDEEDVDLSLRAAPRLPDRMFALLPPPIDRCVSAVDDLDKDLIAIGSLGCVSGLMEMVRVRYDNRFYHPHLFVIIIAPPATGKGKLRLTRQLVESLQRRIRKEWEAEVEKYNALPAELKRGVPPPPPRAFIFPGDTSNAALVELIDGSGGTGLIHEPEIDGIATAQGQDWGQFGSVLRQAAEHEPISVARKGETTYIEHPKLAIVLSGTPGQVRGLINSAENGLNSRFGYHIHHGDESWRSPRPRSGSPDPLEAVKEAGERMNALHLRLSERDSPLEVELDTESWDLIDAVFRPLKEWAVGPTVPPSFVACLHRAGVMAVRYAMTAATLRQFAQGADLVTMEKLKLSEDDVELGLILALHHLDHGYRQLIRLPTVDDGGDSESDTQRNAFFDLLPDEFVTNEAKNVGKKIGVSPRTVHNYLEKLISENRLERVKTGHYKKIDSAFYAPIIQD